MDSRFLGLLADAAATLARLDERLSSAPACVTEGWLARTLMGACQSVGDPERSATAADRQTSPARAPCETSLHVQPQFRILADRNTVIIIAVGNAIAGIPPHRSERAQFEHSAPTSGA